jgi:hypothetical protein
MPNSFLNLPVPAADGTGAAVDTSGLGPERTVTVQGVFSGTITIEFSLVGLAGPWAELITFNGPGKRMFNFMGAAMRTTRTGTSPTSPGTANIDVAAPLTGGQYTSLAVPPGVGSGAPTDVSAFGINNTVTCLGAFTGVVLVQVSEDGIDWLDCMAFTNPGWQRKDFTAQFMRVTRDGIASGAPVVSVGAANDAGSGGSTAGTNCFVMQPLGGQQGPTVFDDWTELYAALDETRTAAGGGCYTILFDDSLQTPIVIPAGAYDMTGVTWDGGTQFVQTGVSVIDGATLPNLSRIQGNISVRNEGAAPVILADGAAVQIRDGAVVQSTPLGPFFDAFSAGPAGAAAILMDDIAQLGGNGNPVVTIGPLAGGSTFALSLGSQAEVLTDAVSSLGAPGTNDLIAVFRNTSAVLQPQTALNATVTRTILTVPRWRPQQVNAGPAINAAVGDVIQVDPTGAPVAVNLPAIYVFAAGQAIVVKNSTVSLNAITVTPAGADTIDGQATYVMTNAFESVTVVSDGVTNWITV